MSSGNEFKMKHEIPVIIVVAATSWLAVGCEMPVSLTAPARKHFVMPAAGQIKRIHVLLVGAPKMQEEFDIVDHLEEIVDAFHGNEEDPRAAGWKYFGDLLIQRREAGDGDIKIELFSRPDTFEFWVDGTYYVGGPTKRLNEVLEKRRPKRKAG